MDINGNSNILEMNRRRKLSPSGLFMVAVVFILILSQVLELVRLCLYERHMQHTRWYHGRGPCARNEKDRLRMLELVNKTIKVLRDVGVEPVLCYGTLWGALRHGDILQWDDNIDICARATDLNNTAVQKLQFLFRSENIALGTYSWWYGHFKLELDTAVGYLTLFSDCTDWFYRSHSDVYMNSPPDYLPKPEPEPQRWACPSGLYFHAFFRMEDVYQPFPLWLIVPPFGQASLAGVKVSVPHDGVEIQKYMYPGDWWRTSKPRGCD